MTESKYRAVYPEAYVFLEYLRNPQVSQEIKNTFEGMPEWKTQFLSGYNLNGSVPKTVNSSSSKRAA